MIAAVVEPAASRPYMPGYGILPADQGRGLLPWSWAVSRLRTAHDYWLATTWPDGGAHVMPVWGVWHDDALWFSSSLASRKARNLEHDGRCVLTTDDAKNPVIIEGDAERVDDPVLLLVFNDTLNTKYDTSYTVDFYDPATNGVWTVRPTWVFALDGDDFTGSPTRWELEWTYPASTSQPSPMSRHPVGEPRGDLRQLIGEQDHAEDREDGRRHERDRARMTAKPGERAVSLPIASPTARNDTPSPSEYAMSRTVARRDVLTLGREQEHGSENRADARRPPEAERGAGDRCGERAEAVEVRLEAELLVEARRGQDLRAREIRGHQQHEGSRDAGERLLVAEHLVAHRGGDETEQHEDQREPEHEHARC